MPLPELPADFTLDADQFEAVALMQRNAGLLGSDDSGEDGMEAVLARNVNHFGQECGTNPGSVEVTVDVYRVLDRRSIARSVPIEAQATKSDDLVIDLHNQHHQTPGALLDPPSLLVDGASHQVEGDGGLEDFSVVHLTDGFGVGHGRRTDSHG